MSIKKHSINLDPLFEPLEPMELVTNADLGPLPATHLSRRSLAQSTKRLSGLLLGSRFMKY